MERPRVVKHLQLLYAILSQDCVSSQELFYFMCFLNFGLIIEFFVGVSLLKTTGDGVLAVTAALFILPFVLLRGADREQVEERHTNVYRFQELLQKVRGFR